MNEKNQHCIWLNHTDTCQNMQTDLCYTEHGRQIEGWPMGPTKWNKNSQKWPKSMFCHRKGANRQDKILCWIELGLKRVCKEEILYWSRGVKGAPMGINKLGQKWPKMQISWCFFSSGSWCYYSASCYRVYNACWFSQMLLCLPVVWYKSLLAIVHQYGGSLFLK